MSKYIKIIFLIAFFGLISLPFVQTLWPFLPETSLNGVVFEDKAFNFSWSNWFTGDFQKYFDGWLSDHLGLRAYFVKTDNQLNFSLFQEISQKTNAPIVVGRNNQLYEKGYIDDYQSPEIMADGEIEDKVKNIKELQNLVESLGKKFIVLISPSKAVIYPEYLPPGVVKYQGDKLTNYNIYRDLLDKYQVPYFDSHVYLSSLKQSSPHVLFAKGGIHWNYLGACLVSAQLFYNLDKSDPNWPQISCADIEILQQARKEDRDLADLINIWQEEIFDEPLPYPRPRIINSPAYRPRLLIVGGSFIWNILRVVKEAKIIGNSSFYYYFSKNSQYPSNTFLPLDKGSLNIKEIIKDHDVVILESNETGLKDIGFGFIEMAISQFK